MADAALNVTDEEREFWEAHPLALFPRKTVAKVRKCSVALLERGNPPRGTVLMLSSSADHFSDLRGHSYERSYDGIWGTGGGFDGTGAAYGISTGLLYTWRRQAHGLRARSRSLVPGFMPVLVAPEVDAVTALDEVSEVFADRDRAVGRPSSAC